jgi:RNA polymerase sigma-70 factor (ECF subfamily)
LLSYSSNEIPDSGTSLRANDERGFSIVYDQYYLSIYFFVKKFVKDPQQAEDITADTFIKLWQYAQSHLVRT